MRIQKLSAFVGYKTSTLSCVCMFVSGRKTENSMLRVFVYWSWLTARTILCVHAFRCFIEHAILHVLCYYSWVNAHIIRCALKHVYEANNYTLLCVSYDDYCTLTSMPFLNWIYSRITKTYWIGCYLPSSRSCLVLINFWNNALLDENAFYWTRSWSKRTFTRLLSRFNIYMSSQ